VRNLILALGLGVAAVIVGTMAGGAGAILGTLAAPPILIRAGLVGMSTVVALALLARAIAALGDGAVHDRGISTMIRGVRLAFLAIAALAAAGGWFVGEPVLLVVALVIAGVDVVETTFLLIVASRHHIDDRRA
jgi:hypothetical protein